MEFKYSICSYSTAVVATRSTWEGCLNTASVLIQLKQPLAANCIYRSLNTASVLIQQLPKFIRWFYINV